ncbi:MAG: CDP-glycerol glycerophosphotransferase family protein [Clostridium sp.]
MKDNRISLITKIESKLVSLIVRTIGLLFQHSEVKPNRICYISYKYTKLIGDMKLIREEIIKNKGDYGIDEVEEIFLFQKFSNTILSKIKYSVQIIKQIYYVTTSKIVIIDGNNIVISSLNKKEEVTIIQIWHATGAIKKFGYDYKRIYPIKNYDYVFTSSEKSKGIMASAFNMKEEQVIPIGVASTDRLFNKKILDYYKEEMRKKYKIINGKKVILYAPTFRGDGIFNKAYIDMDIERIQKSLGEEWVIIYKHHPLNNEETFKYKKNKNIINGNNQNLYKLFSITDVLISDYSAIIYDFTILERPIILFVPDLEEYENERGFYINYKKEIPGIITTKEEEIIKVVKENNFDIEKIKNFKNNFFYRVDGKASLRISRFILKRVKESVNSEISITNNLTSIKVRN